MNIMRIERLLSEITNLYQLSENDKVWRCIDQKPVPERSADEWTRYLSLRENMKYLEYRLSCLERFRREVRAWRNSKRLPKTAVKTNRQSA